MHPPEKADGPTVRVETEGVDGVSNRVRGARRKADYSTTAWVKASMSSLGERQNQPRLIRLLRAVSVAHARAQRLAVLQLGVSVAVAASGVVAAFASVTATPITILGGLWAIAYGAGLAAWGGNELRRAAVLQEMFDVELLELPWNPVAAGEPLGGQEVSRLSRQYRRPEALLLDYYIVPAVPRPYDVLSCQQQNLGWGARIRRRYSRALLTGVGAWSGLGLLVAWPAGLTVPELLLRWYVPSLGILLLALETYRAQRDAAAERERLLTMMETHIRSTGHEPRPQAAAQLLTFARQVQDAIFQSRARHTRVPELFFRRFRTRDRIDFEVAMADLQRLVTTDPDPDQRRV
jgi:SMODS-associating 4TM effector domain